MLAELPFYGIEISAPDLEIGASLCTLVKMCYISKQSLAAVWMNKNLPESQAKPSLTTMMKKHQLFRTKGLAAHQNDARVAHVCL